MAEEVGDLGSSSEGVESVLSEDLSRSSDSAPESSPRYSEAELVEELDDVGEVDEYGSDEVEQPTVVAGVHDATARRLLRTLPRYLVTGYTPTAVHGAQLLLPRGPGGLGPRLEPEDEGPDWYNATQDLYTRPVQLVLPQLMPASCERRGPKSLPKPLLVREEDEPRMEAAWPAVFGPELYKTCLCPILGTVMKDPVVAADGHTYERGAILKWFRTCRRRLDPRTGLPLPTITSPLTGEPMAPTWVPNHSLRQLLSALLDASRRPPPGTPKLTPTLDDAPPAVPPEVLQADPEGDPAPTSPGAPARPGSRARVVLPPLGQA